MPVTAKLSRKFYDRLGDEIAGELVDWFNAVDSTYQTQLRELNEMNWERFRGELRAQAAEIRTDFRNELRSETTLIRAELSELRGDLMKWMFIYWSGTMASLAAFVWWLFQR